MKIGQRLVRLLEFALPEPESFKGDPEKIIVPTSQIRFLQSYVKTPVVGAKKLVPHLKRKYGDSWKNHLDELVLTDPLVIQELRKPRIGGMEIYARPSSNGDQLYAVQNGTHSAYSAIKNGAITLSITPIEPLRGTERLYNFDELRVEAF